MGYKMNGFSGFGNSPAKQKVDSDASLVIDQDRYYTEEEKEEAAELFLKGKYKDKEGNIKDIQWTPQPQWTIEGTKENIEYKRKKQTPTKAAEKKGKDFDKKSKDPKGNSSPLKTSSEDIIKAQAKLDKVELGYKTPRWVKATKEEGKPEDYKI